MKQLVFLFLLAGFVACNNTPKGEQAEVTTMDTTSTEVQPQAANGNKYTVDVQSTLLNYEGSKPTGKHNGTVNLKSGMLTFENGLITSGNVVFDMSTIDDKSTNGEMKAKLEGHLKSPDFFDVAQFPEAKFELVSMTALEKPENDLTHNLTGKLTIKGISQQLTLKAKLTENGNQISIEAPQFVFDRTLFGIKYNSKKFFSALKDKLIYDEIGISFKLVASK
ncbi:MAG: YceI family protein [Saprospiraceae bacterium]|nr:YceI family protein [Saprospiraceae bacterium]